MNSLEPYLLLLDSHWTAGCSNGAELWRRLKADGFGGSPRVVSEWATRRRRTECVTEGQLRKVPSARTIVWMMTMASRSSHQSGLGHRCSHRGWSANAH